MTSLVPVEHHTNQGKGHTRHITTCLLKVNASMAMMMMMRTLAPNHTEINTSHILMKILIGKLSANNNVRINNNVKIKTICINNKIKEFNSQNSSIKNNK